MQKTALALNYTHVGSESSSREGGGGGKGWGRQLTKSGKAKEQQEKAQTRRRDCDKLILQCVSPPYVFPHPPPPPVLVFHCPLLPSLPLSADFLSAFNGTFCQ